MMMDEKNISDGFSECFYSLKGKQNINNDERKRKFSSLMGKSSMKKIEKQRSLSEFLCLFIFMANDDSICIEKDQITLLFEDTNQMKHFLALIDIFCMENCNGDEIDKYDEGLFDSKYFLTFDLDMIDRYTKKYGDSERIKTSLSINSYESKEKSVSKICDKRLKTIDYTKSLTYIISRVNGLLPSHRKIGVNTRKLSIYIKHIQLINIVKKLMKNPLVNCREKSKMYFFSLMLGFLKFYDMYKKDDIVISYDNNNVSSDCYDSEVFDDVFDDVDDDDGFINWNEEEKKEKHGDGCDDELQKQNISNKNLINFFSLSKITERISKEQNKNTKNPEESERKHDSSSSSSSDNSSVKDLDSTRKRKRNFRRVSSSSKKSSKPKFPKKLKKKHDTSLLTTPPKIKRIPSLFDMSSELDNKIKKMTSDEKNAIISSVSEEELVKIILLKNTK